MTEAMPPRLRDLADDAKLFALMIAAPLWVPPVAVVALVKGLRLLADPRADQATTLTGAALVIGVATLPAIGLLLLFKRRADRDWAPAVAARRRSPFRPAAPDLVLKQAPGRLVVRIAALWTLTVGAVVLALGLHPAGWVGAAAALALIARLTWRLWTRPVLSISADGFEVRSGSRRLALAWAECAAFTATPRGQVLVTVVVDLGLKPPPAHAIRTGLDHRNAEELAALLSSYLPAGTVRRTG